MAETALGKPTGQSRYSSHGLSRSSQAILFLVAVMVVQMVLLANLRGAPPGKENSDCSGAQEPKAFPTDREIWTLMNNLDDPNRFIRENAYQRLLELGPAAQPAIWKARPDQSASVQIRQSVYRLASDLQDKFGIYPVRAGELEFQTITDKVWHIPPAGKKSPGLFALKITNRGNKRVIVPLTNLISFTLTSADGDPLKGGFDRDPPIWGKGPLNPGESGVADEFRIRLCRSDDGKDIWLEGTDGKNGLMFRNLKRGRDFVQVFYDSRSYEGSPARAKDGALFWVGAIAMPPVLVEIEMK